MAQDEDGYSAFDARLGEVETSSSPWVDGTFVPDLNLLRELLSIPIAQGDKQESGRPAKAFDAWIAHELRRAGFPGDGVFPRLTRPRVLPDGIGPMEAKLLALITAFHDAEAGGERLKPPALRRAIRAVEDQPLGTSSAYILGDFYAKQVDVGLAAWNRGPDILISTKTMFSAYGKNLKNRHEEAVGEISSLRRRHPMAAMGYAYVVRGDILDQPNSYAALYDILVRLRRPGETFDATLLLVADWDDASLGSGLQSLGEPAQELNAARFFADLVTCALDRTPNTVHREVRVRRGGMPIAYPEIDDPIEAE